MSIFRGTIEPCPCSLTSEVPVEVVQPAHLQLQLVPHGFLQGFPLGGGLGKVFIGLWHQLDLCFQLPTGKGGKEGNHVRDGESEGDASNLYPNIAEFIFLPNIHIRIQLFTWVKTGLTKAMYLPSTNRCSLAPLLNAVYSPSYNVFTTVDLGSTCQVSVFWSSQSKNEK